MESRINEFMNTETYTYTIDAELIEQSAKELAESQGKNQNGSLEQLVEEAFFSSGRGSLRSVQLDFVEREYKIGNLSYLGFSNSFALKIAGLHQKVEDKAAIVLAEKLQLMRERCGDALLLTIPAKKSVDEKLQCIQSISNRRDVSEYALVRLKELFGCAETAGGLLIREKLIEVIGSTEAADQVIAAYSQEPSYLVNRVISGAFIPVNLLVRAPKFSSGQLFQDEEDHFYLKFTSREFSIITFTGEELGMITTPVETLFRLETNDKGEPGFKLVNVKTNDENVRDMFLGRIFNHKEIMKAYSSQSDEAAVSSFCLTPGAIALFAFAATVGSVATAGVAIAIGVSLTTTAVVAGVGAVGGIGVAAGSSAKGSRFFSPPPSTPATPPSTPSAELSLTPL